MSRPPNFFTASWPRPRRGRRRGDAVGEGDRVRSELGFAAFAVAVGSAPTPSIDVPVSASTTLAPSRDQALGDGRPMPGRRRSRSRRVLRERVIRPSLGPRRFLRFRIERIGVAVLPRARRVLSAPRRRLDHDRRARKIGLDAVERREVGAHRLGDEAGAALRRAVGLRQHRHEAQVRVPRRERCRNGLRGRGRARRARRNTARSAGRASRPSAVSTIDLIGARPEPPASATIGPVCFVAQVATCRAVPTTFTVSPGLQLARST